MKDKSDQQTWHFSIDKVFPMEFDVDLMYPLYHHQYQVKIPEVYVLMNKLILMDLVVDEIYIGKKNK